MTSFTNPKALNMLIPDYTIDNIIGIHTGSFSISAPTSSGVYTTATNSFSTGFGDTCLFQGVFSTDGGTTWNDFGAMKPNLTTAGEPVLQTVTCYGYVESNGTFIATGLNYYDNVHSSGTAYTIQYKVAFLAKDNQGAVTPLATNEILQYDSAYNFQKVFSSGSYTNGSSSHTVTHNLGYVPKVREWFIPTSSTSGGSGTVLTIPAGALVTADWFGGYTYIQVNTTQAIFSSVNNGSTISGTVIYRIYWDS